MQAAARAGALRGPRARGPEAAPPAAGAGGAGDPRRARDARGRHRRGAYRARPRPGGLRGRPALRTARCANPVGNDGRFLPGTPLVAGLRVDEANPVIIEALRSRRASCCTRSSFRHSYPVCWRHKIAGDLPRHAAVVHQHGARAACASTRCATSRACSGRPAWGEQRITGMIETRPDWCISRQRTWGVPIPLFVHKDTGELHPRTQELIEAAAARVAQERHRCLVRARGARAARRRGRALRQGHRRHGRVGGLGAVVRMRRHASAPRSRPRWSCTWRAPTSIAAGSTPRCSCPRRCTSARPTRAC